MKAANYIVGQICATHIARSEPMQGPFAYISWFAVVLSVGFGVGVGVLAMLSPLRAWGQQQAEGRLAVLGLVGVVTFGLSFGLWVWLWAWGLHVVGAMMLRVTDATGPAYMANYEAQRMGIIWELWWREIMPPLLVTQPGCYTQEAVCALIKPGRSFEAQTRYVVHVMLSGVALLASWGVVGYFTRPKRPVDGQ